jgi:drug/metabolite transporter (DMT)-like permease
MPEYAIYALLAAIGISAYALLTKVILRYRICSAAYVAFATGAAAAIPCVIGLTFFGASLPAAAIVPLCIATVSGFLGLYSASLAMQEADPSTVVPVMGMKIPAVAVLSVWLLGEVHPWPIYLAAGLAFAGVSLFGLGPQLKAQGGHGLHPLVGVFWAAGSAAAYALSDIYIRQLLVHMNPLRAAMWNYTCIGLMCLPLLFQPGFRQYTVKIQDAGLLLLNALILLASVLAFFVSIHKAGQVTGPNIIFALRGFVTLAAGYTLNKMLKVSLEHQPGVVYVLRVAGTLLLFAAVAIALRGA